MNHPYFPALDWAGYERGPLLAVPLLPGENLAAHRVGHARVLALLAVQTRFRPYPWWFDGTRAPVLDYEAHATESLLARTRVVQAPYFELAYSAARLEIRLRKGDCAKLHQVLRDASEGVVLIPRLSTTASQSCVWQPDRGRQVVFWYPDADGNTLAVHGDLVIGANFLLLVPGDHAAATGPSEDGFVLGLADPQRTRLLACLAAGESFACDVAGARAYEVVVRVDPEDFVVLVPNPTATSSRRRPPLRRIELDRMNFLDGAEEIPEDLSAEVLSDFIEEALLIADDALDGVTTTCPQIVLEFTLASGEPVQPLVRIPRGGEVPKTACQALAERLAQVTPPPIRAGRLHFQLAVRFLH